MFNQIKATAYVMSYLMTAVRIIKPKLRSEELDKSNRLIEKW